MNTKSLMFLLIPLILTFGCVKTVSERRAGAIPLVKDKIEGRYERPPQQVYDAAVYVIKLNGTLQNEITIYDEESSFVRAIEGRVNQRRVWIRVESVDPKVASVVVQARTSAGGSDMDLAYELEKQIALQLVK